MELQLKEKFLLLAIDDKIGVRLALQTFQMITQKISLSEQSERLISELRKCYFSLISILPISPSISILDFPLPYLPSTLVVVEVFKTS